MQIKIFSTAIAATATAHGDEISARIDTAAEVFSGAPQSAVDFLKGLPMPSSVEVRFYRASGEWCGTRSCMNKPALWEDILAREAAEAAAL